jgi:hypothetical protein
MKGPPAVLRHRPDDLPADLDGRQPADADKVAARLAGIDAAIVQLSAKVDACYALLVRLSQTPPPLPAPLPSVSASSTLSRTDHARLSRLLPAIAGAFGSERFTARDCLDQDAPPAIRIVMRGLNARRLGRLLQRGEGQVIAGYVVERTGLELGVVLWRVLQVPEFRPERNSEVPPRPATAAV